MADSEIWKEMKTSSGVTVLYGPFPGGLYWDLMGRLLDEHPDPEPPMKEIETFDGPEEVEDIEDPEYKAALSKARLARADKMGRFILETCVEIADGGWEADAERLADKWAKDPLPDDPLDRKVWYLEKYVLRTVKDWEIIGRVQRFSQIEDEEVRQRAEFFRGHVEGPEGAGADAPGAGEEQRVEVQREAT